MKAGLTLHSTTLNGSVEIEGSDTEKAMVDMTPTQTMNQIGLKFNQRPMRTIKGEKQAFK
ncbi:MAG: hypothetical protein NWF04_00875 [Candidatus Bathyarchaeota archaeon]|nr:hypothetical protein [Candidatus Bathyarchaeota archaeon]